MKLWIDNDEGSHEYWREAAQESWRAAGRRRPNRFIDSRKDNAEAILGDRLKDEHEEAQPTVSGVFADLLNAAMGAVNWHEIATALLDDAEVEEDGDEDDEDDTEEAAPDA